MDVDQCLAIAILRMKMWGVVVFKEHLDHDAKKATDLRHALAHRSGAGEKILFGLFPVTLRYKASGHRSTWSSQMSSPEVPISTRSKALGSRHREKTPFPTREER